MRTFESKPFVGNNAELSALMKGEPVNFTYLLAELINFALLWSFINLLDISQSPKRGDTETLVSLVCTTTF